MPGSGSRTVTVGDRAALLQYQTSAEDGVIPRPPWPPSAACPLPLDDDEEDEADYLPLDGVPAASRRPAAGSSPRLGCGTTVGEKYHAVYLGIYQCGPVGGHCWR